MFDEQWFGVGVGGVVCHAVGAACSACLWRVGGAGTQQGFKRGSSRGAWGSTGQKSQRKSGTTQALPPRSGGGGSTPPPLPCSRHQAGRQPAGSRQAGGLTHAIDAGAVLVGRLAQGVGEPLGVAEEQGVLNHRPVAHIHALPHHRVAQCGAVQHRAVADDHVLDLCSWGRVGRVGLGLGLELEVGMSGGKGGGRAQAEASTHAARKSRRGHRGPRPAECPPTHLALGGKVMGGSREPWIDGLITCKVHGASQQDSYEVWRRPPRAGPCPASQPASHPPAHLSHPPAHPPQPPVQPSRPPACPPTPATHLGLVHDGRGQHRALGGDHAVQLENVGGALGRGQVQVGLVEVPQRGDVLRTEEGWRTGGRKGEEGEEQSRGEDLWVAVLPREGGKD